MKKQCLTGILGLIFLLSASFAEADTIETYLSLGSLEGSVAQAEEKVKSALEAGGFSVIGTYSPAGDPALHSIVFTRGDLQEALAPLEKTRMLAAALKVGLKEADGKVAVSIVNPEFLFRAYTQKEFSKAEGALMKIHNDVIAALGPDKGFGKPKPFGGGGLKAEKLYKYHYMFGMEYFHDMVSLNRKAKSFDELIGNIEKNLEAKKGGAEKVYTILLPDKKIAVYGVALTDKDQGEPHFLPIIGTDHVAAMPYELIVIDNNAFMLHGRYRIAIHWPALTMLTFGKIMSTPGDIADQMGALTE